MANSPDTRAGAVRLTRMTDKEVPEVHRLERLCFSLPWDIEAYFHEAANPYSYYQVAWVGEQMVGFGGMWAAGGEAHVVTLAVDPAYRRRGIGRILMDALLHEARRLDAQRVTLEVRAGNTPAQGLYLSLGFHTVARRRKYYPDNGEDALVMALVLAPET